MVNDKISFENVSYRIVYLTISYFLRVPLLKLVNLDC